MKKQPAVTSKSVVADALKRKDASQLQSLRARLSGALDLNSL